MNRGYVAKTSESKVAPVGVFLFSGGPVLYVYIFFPIFLRIVSLRTY